MTSDEIRAAARACIQGPTARLSESEAAERTERLRQQGHGRPVSKWYIERYSVAATILDSGRVLPGFNPDR